MHLHGKINLLLLVVIIGAILMSASWKPGITFTVLGTPLALQDLLRDVIFVLVTFASLWLTKTEHRKANDFKWGPIEEVALLFAGIFICIVPVMAMLQAGANGPFAPLVALVSHADGTPNNAAYFWLTGILSSFLDNAPTYLVFFELTGGDAKTLMASGAATLAAISAGAVFMGANTYIGNAPKFHGLCHRPRRGHKNAKLLRLHPVVGCGADPGLPGDDMGVFHLSAPRWLPFIYHDALT